MPPSPPVYGSAQFNASLQEVKQIANNRTAEELQIAEYWNNDPPGLWNQIACNLTQSYHLNELRSARALALMNLLLESEIHLLVSAAHSGGSENKNSLYYSELPIVHLRSFGFLRRGGRGFELHFPEGVERLTGKGPASICVPTLRRNPLPV
jgi:hypothetical protein